MSDPQPKKFMQKYDAFGLPVEIGKSYAHVYVTGNSLYVSTGTAESETPQRVRIALKAYDGSTWYSIVKASHLFPAPEGFNHRFE